MLARWPYDGSAQRRIPSTFSGIAKDSEHLCAGHLVLKMRFSNIAMDTEEKPTSNAIKRFSSIATGLEEIAPHAYKRHPKSGPQVEAMNVYLCPPLQVKVVIGANCATIA